MHSGFWIGLAMAGGFVLLLWKGITDLLAEANARSRSPFSEKLRRPAGESLRLEIAEIRDQLAEVSLSLMMSVLGPAVIIMLSRLSSPVGRWVIYTTLGIFAVGAGRRQWLKLKALAMRLRDLRLGFDGERYVGEELNSLMTRGYRIFHDFLVDWKPGGRVFNIDHIAIGPEGIFAVETKARRKPLAEPRNPQRRHEVIYDGRTLRYPDWESDEHLTQATDAANDLSKWLTGTAAVPVEVIPILVIPGWWIERTGKGRVRVFSGKDLSKSLPGNGRPRALSPEQVQILGDRVEAHCRNIEGA